MSDGNDFDGIGIRWQTSINQPVRLAVDLPAQRAVAATDIRVRMLKNVGNRRFDPLNE